MLPVPSRPLAWALLWSATAVLLARLSLPLAAAWAVLGLLRSRRSSAGGRTALLALPALLAALPHLPRAPSRDAPTTAAVAAVAAVAGAPVRFAGRVADVVRAPLVTNTIVRLEDGTRCVVDDGVECVPGDAIRGLGSMATPAVPGDAPTLRAAAATLEVRAGPPSCRRACARLRRALERALLELVPGKDGPTVATLVLGRATRPDFELAEAHRATGLSHLLAVSGAHAAMLAFLLGLARRGRQLGASRARAGAVLAVLLVYGGVAGAEPPVLRAVVAFALATVAARRGRPFPLATGLLAPALLTCFVAPLALTEVSFLLSYAAVIGLALALPQRPPEGPRAWLGDALRASCWASLCTAPLTLHYFDQLAPWTIVLTPLCAPVVAAMLLLGLLAGATALFAPTAALVFAWPLRGLVRAYSALVTNADDLPGTPIAASYAPAPWAIALALAIGVGWVARRRTRASVAAALLLVCATWFVPSRPPGQPGIELFAVGHGQALLARMDDGRQVLFDCGSLHGGARAARAVAGSLDRRALDLLVVTHDDADHHGGVPRLLQSVTVRRALLPPSLADGALAALLRANGVPVAVATPGARRAEGADLVVFAPDLPAGARDNDLSLWARLTISGASVLLTGDAQELGTAAALAARFAGPCDALVLPHHGRPNANLAALLARARPRVCLASAASGDGETAAGRVARRFGARVWVTGQHGDLTVRAPPLRVARAAPAAAYR